MSRRRITLAAETRRPGVNLTPIMDVVFILVIFFMLAAQFVRQAEQPLALAPAGDRVAIETDAAPPQELRLEGQQVLLDGQAVRADALVPALSSGDDTRLLITVGADAPYQALVTALDAAAKAGRTRVATRTMGDGSQEAKP